MRNWDNMEKTRTRRVIEKGGLCLPKVLYEKIENRFGISGNATHMVWAQLQDEGWKIWFWMNINEECTLLCWIKKERFIPVCWENPLNYNGGMLKDYKIRTNSPIYKSEKSQEKRFWELIFRGFDFYRTGFPEWKCEHHKKLWYDFVLKLQEINDTSIPPKLATEAHKKDVMKDGKT